MGVRECYSWAEDQCLLRRKVQLECISTLSGGMELVR